MGRNPSADTSERLSSCYANKINSLGRHEYNGGLFNIKRLAPVVRFLAINFPERSQC